MLGEYIDSRVWNVHSNSPARRCPSGADIPGSPPGVASTVPLPLVLRSRVGLWRLDPGGCPLTNAAYLLSHPRS